MHRSIQKMIYLSVFLVAPSLFAMDESQSPTNLSDEAMQSQTAGAFASEEALDRPRPGGRPGGGNVGRPGGRPGGGGNVGRPGGRPGGGNVGRPGRPGGSGNVGNRPRPNPG